MFRLRPALGRLPTALTTRPLSSLSALQDNTPSPLRPPLRPRSPAAQSLPHARNVKTKTTIKLSDLPQGRVDSPQKLSPSPSGDGYDGPAYPTVVLQARRTMNKFVDCVLLTRVGGFYELYFEHAEEYAPLLNIKLTAKKTGVGPVPMAGFPFFQLDRFLKTLVQDLNRHVAIAEEFPNTAADKIRSGGLMHDRKVTRIVTPGTLIDENFMDPYANNYVMAIHIHGGSSSSSSSSSSSPATIESLPQPPGSPDQELSPLKHAASTTLGLAWLDISTGHFFTQSTTMASLPNILSRISPREIVLDREFESQREHDVFSVLADDKYVVSFSQQNQLARVEDWTPFLETQVPEATAKGFSEQEVNAGGLVLDYVRDRLQGTSMKLQAPQSYQIMKTMSIDKNSLRGLEIKQTIRDGTLRGSLLHAIRRTVTKSGARLLSEWLGAPSTSLDVIRGRQDTVARFIESSQLRDAIILLLRRSYDSQRLVQKFALGRGDPDDLLGIASTIYATQDIVGLLLKASAQVKKTREPDCLAALAARIDLKEPLKLAKKIEKSIDEEGILQQHEAENSEASHMMALAEDIVSSEGSQGDAASLPKGRPRKPTSIKEHYAEDNETWVIRPQASKALKKLHGELEKLQDERLALTDTLRERLHAPSLTLRWNPALGHIAHVKGKDARSFSDAKTLSASRSTRSFHIAEWIDLGQRLDQLHFRIRREEQVVFQSLREQVVLNLVKLRRVAAVLDELDIATSFAKLAIEQDLVRPLVDDSTRHAIVGGRHPTVERGLREQGRSFVRNDCLLGGRRPQAGSLWLITGPNMAGKSTFLRQNALITILAQIGCYVPADHAEIGIVDAIFSRVGSADNLYHDQSTFMVEMLETAQILRQATHRSFVIMDEIGRGTTPEDGTAVAFACLHHLATINRCRALFATHFHDVADMAAAEGFCDSGTGAVQTYCTDVEEDGMGGFVYVHRLRRGVNRSSHALKVARMAGLPEHAIAVARRVLATMPRKEARAEAKERTGTSTAASAAVGEST